MRNRLYKTYKKITKHIKKIISKEYYPLEKIYKQYSRIVYYLLKKF